MTVFRRMVSALALCASVLATGAQAAAAPDNGEKIPVIVSADDLQTWFTTESAGGGASARDWQVEPHTPCYAGTMSCNQTASGRVSLDSCNSSELYAVGYVFNGTAGQSVTFRATSADFAMTLVIGDGRPDSSTTILRQQDEFTRGATATITMSLPFTGPYLVLVTPGTRTTFGNYSVTITCGSSPQPQPPTPQPPSATATTQIVPIVGRLAGAGGSAFRSDVKIYNPTSSVITGTLVFTPRGQSASPADNTVAFSVPIGGVRFYEDVYATGYPGGSGAARLTVITNGSAQPVIDTSTYTATADGGELAQSPTVVRPADFSAAGTKHVALLGKSSERTNVFVMTGTTDTTIRWQYRDASGGFGPSTTRTYAKDATHQTTVQDLIGFPPAANATLEATIVTGSARLAISPVNNVSNQGRWSDFKVTP